MAIDVARTYVATIRTTRGDIVVRLYPGDAPQSVNNFVVLADLGYWDNFPIVYVEPEAFALTGSPAGRPNSDIGYGLPAEVSRPNVAGAVGYWYREDRMASSGSQFYFLLNDSAFLDGMYTVFGEVTVGMEVAQALTAQDVIETILIDKE
jgi:cyclophilin family peptidyl-prolyl cis-trans isomerase